MVEGSWKHWHNMGRDGSCVKGLSSEFASVPSLRLCAIR
jgi:hypothetical protein